MSRSPHTQFCWLIAIMLSIVLVTVPVLGQADPNPPPSEPQIEPPTPQELSPEIPPTVKPVPGEGSIEDDDGDDPAATLEDGIATDESVAGDPAPSDADTIALFYLRRCSGCHTIGRGDLDGPDLLPSTSWPRNDLRAAVRRMEKNVGPMTEQQIEGLVDLLESDNLQQRLDEAASRRVAEMAAELDPGSPQVGRRLFFGTRSLANGGIACFACHAVDGQGGNMSVDLTLAYERLGESSLLSAIEEPSFPLMKAAYGQKPVTSQEAVHIVEYLETVGAEAKAAGVTTPPAESVATLHGVAGGLVLLSLGSLVLVVRSRRSGARSRLVRESFRR